MKRLLFLTSIVAITSLWSCKNTGCDHNHDNATTNITQKTIDSVVIILAEKHGNAAKYRIENGVKQAASLWKTQDGDENTFKEFCKTNFVGDTTELNTLFNKLSRNFEILYGNFNKMSNDLKIPLHLDIGELTAIDELFGSYDPSSHLNEDMFNNKIAFITVLNFPFYTLKQKYENANKWSRKDWAFSKMGDAFTSRIPADLLQSVSVNLTNSDTYISEYNIMMGKLLDNNNKTLFPADLKLITHWGLRDELKSNYNKAENLEKQQIIYEVMKHIILQDIPNEVINNAEVSWNPYTNKVTKDGKEITTTPEGSVRYDYLLKNFKALKEIDAHSPQYPTYIQRAFDRDMQFTQEEVEKLFTDYVSSPIVKEVGNYISQRLGRKLQPFDIWYDGFKARSTINEDELTAKTKAKYPTKEAFEKDLPLILTKLGFSKEKADYLTAKITVDASRGAGHAMQSEMKGDKARLRTRVQNDGMNYKGYNIAVHEFGHNVEQTITLYDVDYYVLRGVPNTSFTEAVAFLFQGKDLELLGIKNSNPDKKYLDALDKFWASYEIMGVSLVDMKVWKWLYENPNATPEQLKESVITIAKEVWNKYYADVFGIKDQPILAIYSHMIDAPLYLSAYPLGHLIEFQLDGYLEGKDLAKEMQRIYVQGNIAPQTWMKYAVGSEVSTKPMEDTAKNALTYMKNKK